MAEGNGGRDIRWLRSVLTDGVLILGALFGLVAIFIELAEDILSKERFVWDVPLMLDIHRLGRPWLDTLMNILTLSGESIAIAIVIVLALWLWRRRHVADAAVIVASFAGGMVLSTLLKLLIARPRPHVFAPLAIEHSYSFPSGHAVAAMSLYGLLAILLWQRGRRGWAVVSAVWVLVVDFSRIYLGVHYPSDVLGGSILGLFWVLIVLSVRGWYGGRRRTSMHH